MAPHQKKITFLRFIFNSYVNLIPFVTIRDPNLGLLSKE